MFSPLTNINALPLYLTRYGIPHTRMYFVLAFSFSSYMSKYTSSSLPLSSLTCIIPCVSSVFSLRTCAITNPSFSVLYCHLYNVNAAHSGSYCSSPNKMNVQYQSQYTIKRNTTHKALRYLNVDCIAIQLECTLKH